MRNLYVPITIDPSANADDVQIIKDMHAMGTQRVYLVNNGRFCFESGAKRDAQLNNIKKKRELYESEGFEVGLWMVALGFGDAVTPNNYNAQKNLTRIKSIDGETLDDAICLLDEGYIQMMCDIVFDIAKSGIQMIMLDDEYCLSVRPGIGCACDLHLAKLRQKLGEDIKIEELEDKVFTGGKNKYRDAWIDVMSSSMKNFTRRLRSAVDKYDDTVGLGFCSGYTSWDFEGADALELTEILAGKNKPFLRFTGAPYWVSANRFPRQTLQTVIETVRMQNSWAKARGIDLFGEADCYPRDCFHTPVSHCECYDMGLMMENISDLKYIYDYSCSARYEKMYYDAHMRNTPLYEEISEKFDNKVSVGIRVYEEMRKFRNFDFPHKYVDKKYYMAETLFSGAQAMLSSNAIPTVYEGRGVCGIAFGENAKYVDETAFTHGLIIDAKAAKILMGRGIDVGLASEPREIKKCTMERFEGKYDDVNLFDADHITFFDLKDGVEILSYFEYETLDGFAKIPAAYRYENAKGQRFLVYAFISQGQSYSSSLYQSYSRGKQIRDNMKWLSGKELPTSCIGVPHMYCITRENEKKISVGYLNLSPDEAYDFQVKFADDIEKIELINCSGELINKKQVKIDYAKAFGFVGIVATKTAIGP